MRSRERRRSSNCRFVNPTAAGDRPASRGDELSECVLLVTVHPVNWQDSRATSRLACNRINHGRTLLIVDPATEPGPQQQEETWRPLGPNPSRSRLSKPRLAWASAGP